MSTPCYTRVFAIWDGRRRELCRAYRFQDGYPSGHGLELAEFLLNNRARFKHMSGGEVAPMLIAHFASAEELRLILEPVEPSRMTGGGKLDYLDGAEWEYHVLVDGHAHSIQVEVLIAGFGDGGHRLPAEVYFSGGSDELYLLALKEQLAGLERGFAAGVWPYPDDEDGVA